MMPTAENALPVGPIRDDMCKRHGCGKTKAAHEGSGIFHAFEEPPIRPYDHEVVAAMITTEWHCHACGGHNDVWGTGATEGYMECGGCGAWSWLEFDPPGYEAAALDAPPAPTAEVRQDSRVHDLTWDQFRHAVWSAHTERRFADEDVTNTPSSPESPHQ